VSDSMLQKSGRCSRQVWAFWFQLAAYRFFLGSLCRLPRFDSFASRLSLSRASRFIWSFIWEYFLNTLASVCRRSCVTHSSATPPALKRVA